jgi:hypothetical protein
MGSEPPWETLLPEHLLQAAYRSSGGEYAWKLEDALVVLKLLSSGGCVVLGVDVWLPTDPGPTIPTPYVYDWDLENQGRSGEGQSAVDFVRTFQWDPTDTSAQGMPPYFNICAALRDS